MKARAAAAHAAADAVSEAKKGSNSDKKSAVSEAKKADDKKGSNSDKKSAVSEAKKADDKKGSNSDKKSAVSEAKKADDKKGSNSDKKSAVVLNVLIAPSPMPPTSSGHRGRGRGIDRAARLHDHRCTGPRHLHSQTQKRHLPRPLPLGKTSPDAAVDFPGYKCPLSRTQMRQGFHRLRCR
jgi:hypothetical protein